MERGAAARFSGRPHETPRSLELKSVFRVDIVHRFSREDFQPAPGADVVLVRLLRKSPPDLPAAQRPQFCEFARRALEYGGAGLKNFFPGRSLRMALGEAGAEGLPAPAQLLYVQWLCLFRRWRAMARQS